MSDSRYDRHGHGYRRPAGRRVLITGGLGYLGSHLAAHLLAPPSGQPADGAVTVEQVVLADNCSNSW